MCDKSEHGFKTVSRLLVTVKGGNGWILELYFQLRSFRQRSFVIVLKTFYLQLIRFSFEGSRQLTCRVRFVFTVEDFVLKYNQEVEGREKK